MNPGMDKRLNKEFAFNVYSETLAEVARHINLNHLQSVLDLLVRAKQKPQFFYVVMAAVLLMQCI